jgi:CheY-like chemotaxis protein
MSEQTRDRSRRRILWVDDEIDQLRSHIIFLDQRGYDVIPASNGEDAISLVADENFDLVLLDEQMPGMDGLSTLDEIKSIRPQLPVVMVTKSEEEELMNEAIGKSIDDYLVKPVNPSQIILAAKRILDARQIREQRMVRDYVSGFGDLDMQTGDADWSDWMDIFARLAQWDIDVHAMSDQSISEMHHAQWRACNHQFGKFIEKNYPDWIADPKSGPITSTDVVKQFVVPHVGHDAPVFFIVIDCLRLDQWIAIEPMLSEYFNTRREHYYSILPTATPYSRNALFSGLTPMDVARQYPDIWDSGSDDDYSLNRYESDMFTRHLRRLGLGDVPHRYHKSLDANDGREVVRNLTQWSKGTDLFGFVFNFIDHLSHGRSESELLQEITPDESSFRNLTVSWFAKSAVFEMMKWVANKGGTVVLTTDHGSILGTRATIARGNKETSTNLRYKFGLNLYCDQKDAVLVKDPAQYGLPRITPSTNFIIAKEDYYFVYPTRYHEYERQYRNSFQHGGISLEEMILPVVTLTPR